MGARSVYLLAGGGLLDFGEGRGLVGDCMVGMAGVESKHTWEADYDY